MKKIQQELSVILSLDPAYVRCFVCGSFMHSVNTRKYLISLTKSHIPKWISKRCVFCYSSYFRHKMFRGEINVSKETLAEVYHPEFIPYDSIQDWFKIHAMDRYITGA